MTGGMDHGRMRPRSQRQVEGCRDMETGLALEDNFFNAVIRESHLAGDPCIKWGAFRKAAAFLNAPHLMHGSPAKWLSRITALKKLSSRASPVSMSRQPSTCL